MQILSTTDFQIEYKKLVKIKKHYSCLDNYLYHYLFDDSFSPKGDLLRRLESNQVSVFKARLKSCTKNGKSYGFRLVYLQHSEFYILLTIYPKWGPKRADDINKEGLEFLLATALNEKENDELFEISPLKQKEKIEFILNKEF